MRSIQRNDRYSDFRRRVGEVRHGWRSLGRCGAEGGGLGAMRGDEPRQGLTPAD